MGWNTLCSFYTYIFAHMPCTALKAYIAAPPPSWLSINFLHVLLLVYVWNLCSYVMISKQKCCFHLNSCTVKSCFKHSQFIFMENFEALPPVWSMKNTCNIYSIWNKEHAYSHFQYFPALPILFRLALEVNWCLPSSAQVSIMIIKTCFFFFFFFFW